MHPDESARTASRFEWLLQRYTIDQPRFDLEQHAECLLKREALCLRVPTLYRARKHPTACAYPLVGSTTE